MGIVRYIYDNISKTMELFNIRKDSQYLILRYIWHHIILLGIQQR